jgi:hypothetical protein
MYGSVYLQTLEEVAEFLNAFHKTGNTSLFRVEFNCSRYGYEIKFEGSY